MARGDLPTGWGTPGGVADDVVDIAKGGKKVAEATVGAGKRVLGAIFGGAKKADAGTTVKKTPSKTRRAGTIAKNIAKVVTIPVGAIATAGYLADQVGLGGEDEQEGLSLIHI